MIANFKEFMRHVIVEELHPELKKIVTSTNIANKQGALAKKIQELSSKGEKTGVEGNMPKGSSRAYLKHDEPHNIILDGKPASIQTGTKVAIKAKLDKFHAKARHDNLSLGAMQNRAENSDHFVNSHYRILTERHDLGKNRYETNHEQGIFPPLFHHDHENHESSHIGHINDVSSPEFRNLTKTKEHPKGISHKEFVETLVRNHAKQNGEYWERTADHEKKLDHIQQHPLVQKFLDYHNNSGAPPHDYIQMKNMGVFHHPDGSKHIVARDHGFDTEVAHAYTNARKKMYGWNS